MEENAWSTPYGRLLGVACGAAAVLGFVISANLLTSRPSDAVEMNETENYEAAADNLEAAADNLAVTGTDPSYAEQPSLEVAPAVEQQADEPVPEAVEETQAADPEVDANMIAEANLTSGDE